MEFGIYDEGKHFYVRLFHIHILYPVFPDVGANIIERSNKRIFVHLYLRGSRNAMQKTFSESASLDIIVHSRRRVVDITGMSSETDPQCVPGLHCAVLRETRRRTGMQKNFTRGWRGYEV